jgi:hypothetical protein
MTSPTSPRSSSNKAQKSKSKASKSRNYHPYANSSGKPNWTIESALGPYMIISFPSRKERNPQDREESPSDKPIGISNLKGTLFERMTKANPSQQTRTSELETASLGADTPQAHPGKGDRSLRQQTPPLLQRLQPPSLLQRLQPPLPSPN